MNTHFINKFLFSLQILNSVKAAISENNGQE